MKATSDGVYVFRSERGGPLSHDIVRLICERTWQVSGFGCARTCCAMRQAFRWLKRARIPG
jgi:hypothetical protein